MTLSELEVREITGSPPPPPLSSPPPPILHLSTRRYYYPDLSVMLTRTEGVVDGLDVCEQDVKGDDGDDG